MLRAWLYRIAHNRCIDELRRPAPLPSELDADAEPRLRARRAPTASRPRCSSAARRSTRLVADVQTLPEQQRSALLMRELQGLSYEELASALGVSVPAVKSLLLRARTGLIDIAVARDAPCERDPRRADQRRRPQRADQRARAAPLQRVRRLRAPTAASCAACGAASRR